MKWCKIVTLFYCCDHFICDHCRSCKFFSTMYDTMSDCIYFFQALDSACFFVCKSIQYKLDSFFVCRHCTLCDFFIKSGFLINQSSVDSDSLAKTLCQNILCIRVDELIFQGGTSAVNYQYIHFNILLFDMIQICRSYLSSAWHCTAVIATTPTISSAEHPLERSLTGFAIPCVTGP